jgi:hypothetical protein
MLGVVGRIIRKSESKGLAIFVIQHYTTPRQHIWFAANGLGRSGRMYNGIIVMAIEQWCLDGVLSRGLVI